jgi:GNAT superfamily N-acetyltransferase
MRTIIHCNNDERTEYFIYFSEDQIFHLNLEGVDKIGYIQYVLDFDTPEVIVSYVYVDEKSRGKGMGKKLMQLMMKHSYSRMAQENVYQYEINLDDTSDHYGKPNNLYSQMGFEYCEMEDGVPSGPEMSMTIRVNI